MAIDFPNSPTDGQQYSVGDRTWTWNGTYWEMSGATTSTFTASDTEPVSAEVGDIWFDSTIGKTFINYNGIWVEVGNSASITDVVADADADTKIQVESSADEDKIRFSTAGTERMIVDNAGNVGIGTTSPSQTLDVRGIARVGDDTDRTPDAAGVGHLMVDGNGYGGFVSLDANAMWVGHNSGSRDLYLATNETARVTVDASGNVGIGTTSPSVNLHVSSGTSGDAELRIEADTDNNEEGDLPYLTFAADGGILEGVIGLNDNTMVFANSVSSSQGFDFRTGTSNYYTNGADVIAGTTSRLFIDSSGNVGIGTTSPSGVFHVYGSGEDLMKFGVITGNQYLYLNAAYNRTTASAGTSQRLESSGVFRRSTSAAKYKKDVEDMDVDRAEVVYDLRPVWYRSAIETDDPNKSYYGFIADEVVDLDPRLVEFDDDGEVEGFHYQTLTSHLVKIVQMQKAEIDALTARIEALEAR